jgi:hypothetical protein
MVFKATEDVVRRVMPLLDQLATESVDKARLLQYLSACAGADWGVLELVGETPPSGGRSGAAGEEESREGDSEQVLTFRDRVTSAEHQITYPVCLPREIEFLVREEYKRLAVALPLTVMAEPLFKYLYQSSHCDHCRWKAPENAQIHRECQFAGHPVNFEPIRLV